MPPSVAPVDLAKSPRLLNHGPTTLVSAHQPSARCSDGASITEVSERASLAVICGDGEIACVDVYGHSATVRR